MRPGLDDEVGGGEVSSDRPDDLAGCFAVCAADLAGYACVLTRGDGELAADLVQGAFTAAAGQWPVVRGLNEADRRRWLRTTVAGLAAELGLAGEAASARPDTQAASVSAGERYAAAYDACAGLDRLRSWLREHACDGVVATAIKTSGDTIPVPFRPICGDPASEVDHAVAELYAAQYQTLVRLAILLVRDTPTAEEVVQDAIVAMHEGWHRLRDSEKAIAYLRQTVVNRSRSVLRHRVVADRSLQEAPPDMPSAEQGALILLDRYAVVAALRDLPERQREAIVLRYYADLTEAQIAATMGISRGAVKSHTFRGMAALRTILQAQAGHPKRI